MNEIWEKMKENMMLTILSMLGFLLLLTGGIPLIFAANAQIESNTLSNALRVVQTAEYRVLGAGVNFDGDLLPSANNTWKLGNSSLQWSQGWFNQLTAVTTNTTTLNASQINDSMLTNGQVVYSGAGGMLQSNVGLTYNPSLNTLTSTTSNITSLNSNQANLTTANVTTLNAPTGRGATYTVASAIDSSTADQNQADYLLPVGGYLGTAITAAQAALGAQGGTVHLDAGTYNYNTHMEINSNVTVEGTGNNSTILDQQLQDAGFTITGTSGSHKNNITFRNFRMNSGGGWSGGSGADIGAAFVVATYADYVTGDSLYFNQCYDDSWLMETGTSHSSLTNSILVGGGAGNTNTSSDLVDIIAGTGHSVTGCWLYNSNADSLHASNTNDGIYTNNHIYYPGNGGAQTGRRAIYLGEDNSTQTVTSNIVSNNMIYLNSHADYGIETAYTDYVPLTGDTVTVTGNQIFGDGVTTTQNGIYLGWTTGTYTSFIVNANRTENTIAGGIREQNVTSTSTTGNTVDGITNGYGMYFNNVSQGTVTGNEIGVTKYEGIYFDSCPTDAIAVSGNDVARSTTYSATIPKIGRSPGYSPYEQAYQNVHETFTVLADNTTYIVNAGDASAATPITFTLAHQPDVPRNLTWTITHANITAFTLVFDGYDALGFSQTVTVTDASGWSGSTSVAFLHINSIQLTARTGTGATDTLNVGTGSLIGVANKLEPYNSGNGPQFASPVYLWKINGAGDFSNPFTFVNAQYSTVDVSEGGYQNYNNGDRIDIWYHIPKNNVRVIQ